MRRKTRTLSAYILGLMLAMTVNTALARVTVQDFSPQGEVRQANQAVAVFEQEMVKLGDTDATAPFTIDCPAKGTGRWTDSKTWRYQLQRNLKPGERCTFNLKPGIKSLDGDASSANEPQQAPVVSYSFYPSGPYIHQTYPDTDQSIEEDQVFLILTNVEVNQDSVAKHAYCSVEGLGERVPVQLVSESDKRDVMDALRVTATYTTAFTCQRKLPAGAKVKVVWARGIESSSGGKSYNDETLQYQVRLPFRAELTCEREKPTSPCSPLSDLKLQFSDQVSLALAEKIVLKGASGEQFGQMVSPARRQALIAKNAKQYFLKNALSNADHLDTVVFKGPFEPNSNFVIEVPQGFTDLSGRALDNAKSFPLKTQVGNLPPLAKFAADFGILELNEGGVLPVTVRQVESELSMRSIRINDYAEMIQVEGELSSLERQYKEITPDRKKLKKRSIEGYEDEEYQPRFDYLYPRELPFLAGKPAKALPKLKSSQPFEVLGIPLKEPGFYVVEIESKLLGSSLLSEPKPMYVRTRALVTDMAVHMKHHGENGLVWVTSLSSGKPVAGADVAVYNCNQQMLAQGKTDAQGLFKTDQKLDNPSCNGPNYELIATAKKGNDFSFVRSGWDRGIEAWRFNVDTYSQFDSPKIHTILDRTMLRAGETVSMKHIARLPTHQGYAYVKTALPDHMTISLVGGEFTLDVPLTWDDRGVATSSWKIPQDAGVGTYAINIGSGWRETGHFRVSEFRLPSYKGAVTAGQLRYAAVKEVPLNLSLAYLNGGGAQDQTVQVTSQLANDYFHFDEYKEFRFGIDKNQNLNELALDKASIKLDAHGSGKVVAPIKPALTQPAKLTSEMTFADPNGEIQTIGGSTEIWPVDRVVGLQVKDWAGLKAKHKVQAVVLGLDGKPQTGIEVSISGERIWHYTHRKRVLGGFYSYEDEVIRESLGELCKGKTTAQGFMDCEVSVKEAGDINLTATIKDSHGRVSQAQSGFWVSELGDIWFGQGDEDRMEVIPEKRSYQPGETARIQVHSPFYQAQALIAVEREGILQTFVQPLYRNQAVVEIPIQPNWGPNVYVSVLAVRGRLNDVPWYSFFQWGWHSPSSWWQAWRDGTPAPTALVDLAKPSYKFGLTRIAVGTKGMALNVQVKADKARYKPRELAKVDVKVMLPNGKPAPEGSELALAVVDKALLELNDNPSWNLLDSMTQERAYLMENATAQMQVVGKRHFGKKALPAGGGGGLSSLSTRELFNTLLYWNPRVKVGKGGMAQVRFPLNDSLTAFKVVAVADVNADQFGTGSTEIASFQDLQMTSGLPPMVREGDQYRAMLTLRNTTKQPMPVEVSGKAGSFSFGSQKLTLAAGEAKDIAWQVNAPGQFDEALQKGLPWEIRAAGSDGKVLDAIKFTQKILPKVPVTVQQAQFLQLDSRYENDTALPQGAIPGKGGLEVHLTAKLADQTAAIEQYFRDYPYSCLEQKTSVATGLQDKARWDDITANLASYQDSQGYLQYFPGMSYGSDALTAYVLTMAYENKIKLPEAVERRMREALKDFVAGRSEPGGAWYYGRNKFLSERRLNALAALSYTQDIDTKDLSAFEFIPIQMPTNSLTNWLAIYEHVPNAPQRAERLNALERELRNRMQQVGGKLIFTTESDDSWWWAMMDGEVNATRLVSLLMDDPRWQKDMPELLRGAVLRQEKGRWHTTLANAWGRVALQKFGQKFEHDTISGTTTARLDDLTRSYTWTGAEKNAPQANGVHSKEKVAAKLSLPWAVDGKSQKFSMEHAGVGKPWVNVLLTAAVPDKAVRSGYTIKRTVTPVEQKVKGRWSRGDLMRIRLDVDSEQSMSWVALSDPIPGGASILGNTARDSAIAQQGENSYDGTSNPYPSYTEKGLSFFRAYYEYAPKGHFWVEYTIRLNNPGEFNIPSTRIEAMYASEIFGQLPNPKLTVGMP